MRSNICGAVGLAAVGLLALTPMTASAQRAEFKLLNNKLWQRHSDVLRQQGQPTRIEIGAVLGGGAQQGGGGGMMGAPVGGGMSGGGISPAGVGMGGGMSGSPYGGPAGAAGRMMRGGPGGYTAPPGGGGSPYGGPGGGGLPGIPGMPGGIGGGQDLGLGGPGGGAAGGGGSESGNEGEITWVYERPGGRTDIFLFNKDGRLIQVSSFGYSGPAVTNQGVRLGDPLGKIYAKYGWTSAVSKDAERNTMMLDFSKDHHVAFQLADRGKGFRVVGITIGITELSQLKGFAPGVDFSGARRLGGSMGGMMGAPGGIGGGMSGGAVGGSMGSGGMLAPPPGFGGAAGGRAPRGGKFGGALAP